MTHSFPVTASTWKRALPALAVVAGSLTLTAPSQAAVSAGSSYTGVEGTWVSIQGTDDSVLGNTYTWTAARAVGGEQDHASCTFTDPTALSTTVRCNDDGMFDLTLHASDGSTSTARLMLSNRRPTLTLVTPATGTAVGLHSVVRVSGAFTDGDPIDRHSYVIDWGDGHTSRADTQLRQRDWTGNFSSTHSYGTPGNRTVRVSVFDSHGLSDTATLALQVVGGTPCTSVHGSGRLPHHRRSHFSLSAGCGAHGAAVGSVGLRLRGIGKLASHHLTLVRGHGRTAILAGTGRWRAVGRRAHGGYGFVIKVVDGARDRMNVSVRTPSGVRVLRIRGPIAGGGISVR